MTEYTLITVIVPAETVDSYRAMAALLHPAGAGMFITQLYTGEDITHYISTGKVDTVFTDVLQDPELFAQETGCSEGEAQALKDGVTYLAVGEGGEEPALHNHEAIQSLGLSLTPDDPVSE